MSSADTPVEGDHDDAAAQFRQWSQGARGTAFKQQLTGDAYGAQLATARSVVYAEAAKLVEEHGHEHAANLMIEQAGHHRVLSPPIAQFDPIGVKYIKARAWQFCAQHLNPELPIVQKRWD